MKLVQGNKTGGVKARHAARVRFGDGDNDHDSNPSVGDEEITESDQSSGRTTPQPQRKSRPVVRI